MIERREAIPFCLDEATIDELHHAIRSGQTRSSTSFRCYIERARAYSNVASMLVTEHGRRLPRRRGSARDGSHPLPDRNRQGVVRPADLQVPRPPLEYGRMEATASDPSVWRRAGMIVGSPTPDG
jgi:hypothetical protein